MKYYKEFVIGEGKQEDIYKLEKLAINIQKSAVCGLGQTAPNPVLSTLKYFKQEYIDHIDNKECMAHECKALTKLQIDEDKCKGCGICQKNCPVDAINGIERQTRKIDQSKCIKCGTCIANCPFKAIY